MIKYSPARTLVGLIALSSFFISNNVHASKWVPIANGDITTIIPVPELSVDYTTPYTSNGQIQIDISNIGATTAYYYRLVGSNGSQGAWQCSTATDVISNGNKIIAETFNDYGSNYTVEVSACMTGVGCDTNKFSQGQLACSQFASSSPVDIDLFYKGGSATKPSKSGLNVKRDLIVNTPSQFKVTESGAATISMPISLPKGTAGVKPQIGMSYNSQGRDGIAGKGWNISGLSSITRCGKSIEFDGVQRGITHTSSDRLCMDGQRLILNKSNLSLQSAQNYDRNTSDSAYWHESATYHTAKDSFAVIKPQYQSSLLKAFIVETKSGEAHLYGDLSAITASKTPNNLVIASGFKALTASGSLTSSFSDALIVPEGKTVATTWRLSVIQDVATNYIAYHYSSRDTQNSSGSKTESHIESISYTGNVDKSVSPYARVVFNYKDNKKPFIGYSSGDVITMTKLLDNIKVYSDNHTQREYNLSYFESDYLDERNFLEQIQECVYTSSTAKVCAKQPLEFNWLRRPDVATTTETKCVPPEPEMGSTRYKPELDCYQVTSTTPYKPFNTSKGRTISTSHGAKSMFFDINGDGFSDQVIPNGGWKVKYGPSFTTEKTLSSDSGLDDKWEHAVVMDYNVDGVMDLVVAKDTSSYLTVISDKAIFTGQSCHYRNPQGCSTYTTNVKTTQIKATKLLSGYKVLDVDGDGDTELAYTVNNSIHYYENTGNGLASTSTLYVTLPKGVSASEGTPWEDGTSVTSIIDNGGDLHKKRPGLKNAATFDANGDGLTDLLVRRKSTVTKCNNSGVYLPSLQNDCSSTNYIQWYLVYGKANAAPTVQAVSGISNSEQPQQVDLNGDGLSDIIWRQGTELRYKIANGQSFGATYTAQALNGSGTLSNLNIKSDLKDLVRYMDISADGRTDILMPFTNKDGFTMYLAKPIVANAEKVVFINRGTYSYTKDRNIQFADINGDAQLDFLESDGDKWNVYFSAFKNKLLDVIASYKTSTGVVTQIHHTNITNVTNRFVADQVATYINGYFDDVTDNEGKLKPNYIKPQAGLYVVSAVDTEIKQGTFNSVFYQYGGAVAHTKGRGFLGFRMLRTFDVQTCDTAIEYTPPTYKDIGMGEYDLVGGDSYQYIDYDTCITTTTYYHQDNPNLQGMPQKTEQTIGLASTPIYLSYSENTYKSVATAMGGIHTYVSKSTEKSYASNASFSGSTHIATTITDAIHDAYGNVTWTKSTNQNATATDKQITTTTNSYAGGTYYARFGRLTNTDVVKTKTNSATNTKSASFTYNADLQLETESTSLATTTHAYDDFGQKISKTLSGFDSRGRSVNSIVTSSSYDARGRYIKDQTDPQGAVTTFDYETSLGRITEITKTSPSGKELKTRLDVQGKTKEVITSFTANQASLFKETYTSYCTSSTCAVPQAYLKTVELASNKPTKVSYIDKFGRTLQSAVTRPDAVSHDKWLVSKQTYNNQGQPQYAYEAVSAVSPDAIVADTTPKSHTKYDRLKRPVEVIKPYNLGTVLKTYNGLETTITNELGQKKAELKNYAGQLAKVSNYDLEGKLLTYIDYNYDTEGNLLSASVNNSKKQVENTFDNHGRKTQSIDLDKGTYNYDYNGLGELITQSHLSSSQTTRFTYDVVGKKLTRLDNDGLTCWRYGTAEQDYALLSVSYQKGITTANCDLITNPTTQESYEYGDNGQVARLLTTLEGKQYETRYLYDQYHRVKYTIYPHNNFTIEHEYNAQGVQTKLINRTPGHREEGKVYSELTKFDAKGNLEKVTYGNGVVELNDYDALGRIENKTHAKGNTILHDQYYKFDALNNLKERKHNYAGNAEDYCESVIYDDLNRLEEVTYYVDDYTCSGNTQYKSSQTYDAFGNIKYKSNVGTYQYTDTSKPNRLINAAGKLLTYDEKGNVRTHDGRVFNYTAFDKPYLITKGSVQTAMAYDHNRSMYKRQDTRPEGASTTWFVKGLYERFEPVTGSVEHKYYVGDTVVIDKESGTSQTLYMHKDHLGSTTSITNASGNVVQYLAYDAWGKARRFGSNAGVIGLLKQASPAESKGYTGHKMLSDLNIIHMKGRIYDPTLGRFLQADPHIQAPKNSQNYNRYSYVLNNPLSYTDPTGYFFKALGKFVKKYWRQIASIAVMFIPGVNVMVLDALSGYISTGSLKGALVGAFSAGLVGPANSLGGFITNGVVGGLASKAMGGKFGHGFWSAGIGAMAGGAINGIKTAVGRVVASAVVGGTISKLTGGKFANGAFGAAFARALGEARSTSQMAEADNAEAKGQSDFVTKNETYDLNVEDNKLSGSISVVCNGGESACNGVISEFNKINGTYGDYTIDIDFKLHDGMLGGDLVVDFEKIFVRWEGKMLEANGIYDGESFSLRRGGYSRIRLNPTSGGYRSGSTAFHEFGHSIGLAHQANATRSIMSYSKWRGGLTNVEAQRLINAYH